MSREYDDASEVPTAVLCDRLEELWKAVTEGRQGIDREFYMRIPVEVDHDADVVIAEACKRLLSVRDNLATAVEMLGLIKADPDGPSGVRAEAALDKIHINNGNWGGVKWPCGGA